MTEPDKDDRESVAARNSERLRDAMIRAKTNRGPGVIRVDLETETETETEDKVRFYHGADGAYRWQLCAAGNHEVIAASTEGYTSKQHARENYERVTGRKVPDTWGESLG